MKTIALILSLMTMNFAFSQALKTIEEKPALQFIEINYGSCDYISPVEGDKSGWANSHQVFKISKRTDSIPAKQHAFFGVEFRLNRKDSSDQVFVEEWIYPKPMLEPDGRKYKATKTKVNLSNLTDHTFSYFMDKDFQIIKGDWKLNVYVDNKLMFTRKFILY